MSQSLIASSKDVICLLDEEHILVYATRTLELLHRLPRPLHQVLSLSWINIPILAAIDTSGALMIIHVNQARVLEQHELCSNTQNDCIFASVNVIDDSLCVLLLLSNGNICLFTQKGQDYLPHHSSETRQLVHFTTQPELQIKLPSCWTKGQSILLQNHKELLTATCMTQDNSYCLGLLSPKLPTFIILRLSLRHNIQSFPKAWKRLEPRAVFITLNVPFQVSAFTLVTRQSCNVPSQPIVVALGSVRGEVAIMPNVNRCHQNVSNAFVEHWHHTPIQQLSFCGQHDTLFVMSHEPTATIWSLHSFERKSLFTGVLRSRFCSVCTDFPSQVIVAGGVSHVAVVDLSQRRVLRCREDLPFPPSQVPRVMSLVEWNGSPTLLFAGMPNLLSFYDVTRRETSHVIPIHFTLEPSLEDSYTSLVTQLAANPKGAETVVTFETSKDAVQPSVLRWWWAESDHSSDKLGQHQEVHAVFYPHGSEPLTGLLFRRGTSHSSRPMVISLSPSTMRCWTPAVGPFNRKQVPWECVSERHATLGLSFSVMSLSNDETILAIAQGDSILLFSCDSLYTARGTREEGVIGRLQLPPMFTSRCCQELSFCDTHLGVSTDKDILVQQLVSSESTMDANNKNNKKKKGFLFARTYQHVYSHLLTSITCSDDSSYPLAISLVKHNDTLHVAIQLLTETSQHLLLPFPKVGNRLITSPTSSMLLSSSTTRSQIHLAVLAHTVGLLTIRIQFKHPEQFEQTTVELFSTTNQRVSEANSKNEKVDASRSLTQVWTPIYSNESKKVTENSRAARRQTDPAYKWLMDAVGHGDIASIPTIPTLLETFLDKLGV